MRKAIFAGLITLMPMVALAQNVSSGKIAELTAHRLERLVTLKKVDASFSARLEKVEVSSVSGTAPAPAAYRSLVSQTQPAQGAPMQLELLFDAAGKPLAFKVLPGGVAGPDPQWPTADAQALFEATAHALDESKDAKIEPFMTGFTSFVLTKGTLQGSPVARAQVLSSTTASKLNVYMMLDGMVMSTEILP